MAETGATTYTRGELPTRPTYCTQCQANGHACLAGDGFTLCAFCEDGVPCPFLRAAAERNVAAAKNAPWLAPKKAKAKAAISHESLESHASPDAAAPIAKPARKWDEVITRCLAMPTGGNEEFTVTPGDSVAKYANQLRSMLNVSNRTTNIRWTVKTLDQSVWVRRLGPQYSAFHQAAGHEPGNNKEGEMDRKCKECGEALHPLTNGDVCRGCRDTLKKEDVKTCGQDGCGQRLYANNTTGFCTLHKPKAAARNGKENAGGRLAKPKPPKAAARANGAAKQVPRGTPVLASPDGMATLCVPIAALDTWWGQRSTEEKAEAFGAWILRDQADAHAQA